MVKCKAWAISTKAPCEKDPIRRSQFCSDHQDPSTRWQPPDSAQVLSGDDLDVSPQGVAPVAAYGDDDAEMPVAQLQGSGLAHEGEDGVAVAGDVPVAPEMPSYITHLPDMTDHELFLLGAEVVNATGVGGVPIVWGPPGIGKTRAVQDYGEQMGYEVLMLSASQHQEAADIIGMTVADKDEERGLYLERPPKSWLETIRDLPDGKKVLVFVDELPMATHEVEQAFYNIFQDRYVADVDIELPHEKVMFVAAGNPRTENILSRKLSDPMRDRLVHFELSPPSADERRAWSRKNPSPLAMTAEERAKSNRGRLPSSLTVPPDWAPPPEIARESQAFWEDVSFEFCQSYPDYEPEPFPPGSEQRLKQDAAQKEARAGAYAFPGARGYQRLIYNMSAIEHLEGTAARRLKRNIAVGCVGKTAGEAILAYAEEMDLPNPEDWLSKPSSVSFPRDRDTGQKRADKMSLAMNRVARAASREPSADERKGKSDAQVDTWKRKRVQQALEVCCHAATIGARANGAAALQSLSTDARSHMPRGRSADEKKILADLGEHYGEMMSSITQGASRLNKR